jgi:hypothetical protein
MSIWVTKSLGTNKGSIQLDNDLGMSTWTIKHLEENKGPSHTHKP